MKFPSADKYPKKVYVADETYRVIFCKMPSGLYGITDSETRTIRIKAGMSDRETFKTFIHEVLHAIDFEHPRLKLKHKQVYGLENALFELLVDNFL